MKIGIINNAANYLQFNINLANYLKEFNNIVVFLNCDKYIKTELRKYKFETVDYHSSDVTTPAPYDESSGIVKYFMRLYNLSDDKKLIQKLNREYQNAYSYLKNNHFDYILILNGAFNVETDVCKKLGIKCFFFEHGYFSNCIQMDSQGVNVDASFSKLDISSFLNFSYKTNKFAPLSDFEIQEIPQLKLKRYIIRLSDKRYNQNIFKYIQKKINEVKAVRRFSKFRHENFNLEELKPFIFFPLQVNSDTQIILNSTYSSMYEAIQKVLPILKATGYKIIIKEHPLEVEPVNYSSFIDNEQIILTRKANLDELVKQSKFVVNINSSVGFQAVSKNKKVLTLGECFYNNAPSVLTLKSIKHNNLKVAMEKLRIDKEEISKYISCFNDNIFIKGHFYKPDVNFLEGIRNRLV